MDICHMRTYLFDAFLVLNEELNAGYVNVEPWPLRRALHRSVNTAIVLTAHKNKVCYIVYFHQVEKNNVLHKINKSFNSPDEHLSKAFSIYE